MLFERLLDVQRYIYMRRVLVYSEVSNAHLDAFCRIAAVLIKVDVRFSLNPVLRLKPALNGIFFPFLRPLRGGSKKGSVLFIDGLIKG